MRKKSISKDARSNEVHQVVNATDGTLTSVTDSNGQTVNYTYDESKRVTGVETTADGKAYRNAYTYENDRIKTVAHNTTGDTPDVTYTFNYDELGRKTTVKVGSQTLSTNVYSSDRSGLLKEVQYGNDGKVKYAYDEYDRLTGVRYDDETTDRYTYEYGADGEASVVRNNNLGRVLQTERDLTQRAMGTQLRDTNGNLLYRTELDYDTQNRLAGFGETASGRNYKTAYTYDDDNRITGMTFDGGNAIGYTYDNLGRIATRTTSPLTTTYEYVEGGYGAGSTAPLISSIQQNGISFSYTYDNRGNIVSETRNGLTTTYAYDALGQLVRVNDPHENKTWVYEYDRGGNMTKRIQYAYTIGALGSAIYTHAYTYDAQWKDLLTANGPYPLTYDAMGNVATYGGWVYEWKAGRLLEKQTQNGKVVSYDYDENGMRVRKTFGYTNGYVYAVTDYTYHGKMLTHMKRNSDELHFFYDGQCRPAKVRYNGTMYTYLHNLQGDIVGIVDNDGTLVVEYKYNAWGSHVSKTGSMADTLGMLNPFRYRGYIFDEETWMYWLKDRYYYPELHRFIVADVSLGSPGMLLASNAYIYCWNNPIGTADNSGEWPGWITAVAAIATAVVATVVIAAAVPAAVCAASFTLVYYGVSMATATTVATVGVAAAGTFAVSGYYSDAIETITGTNPIRDVVLSGSEEKYENYRMATDFASAGVMQAAAMSPGVCFVEGTLISTKEGLEPIEEIRVDQQVWAADPETGECTLKRVARTFLNETDELAHVQVGSETITCTAEHPFYVHSKGWVAAIELKPHDRLELQNGKAAFVHSVRIEKLDQPIQVYNFEVEDFHAYFVGENRVLVHNGCGHYEIDYDDGTKYIGKGDKKRMEVSARQHCYDNKVKVRTVINKQWMASVNDRMAFVDEYKRMKDCGFGKSEKLLNRIQSPGYKYAKALGLIE